MGRGRVSRSRLTPGLLVPLLTVMALALGGCGAAGKASSKGALEQDPHHHYRWANEQFRQGHYQEALESINKAIALDPDQYAYYNMRGLIYLSAGDLDQALANFRKVLVINPYLTDVHNNIGVALGELGRRDEAMSEFQSVLRDPGYKHREKALYNVGNLFYAQGDYREAVEQYRKAVAVQPEYLKAYYKMGLALQTLGQMDEARRAFEEVVRIDPNSKEAREVKFIINSGHPAS
ncbi:MAG: tetratricopeptide repeat protein [Acidobacteriota bacterium]